MMFNNKGHGFVMDYGEKAEAVLYFRSNYVGSQWYCQRYTNVDEALYGLEDKGLYNAAEKLSVAEQDAAIKAAKEVS